MIVGRDGKLEKNEVGRRGCLGRGLFYRSQLFRIQLCSGTSAFWRAYAVEAAVRKFYFSDFAYVVKVPELDAFSDNIAAPHRSNYVVYEDDHPLGPAHSEHADISKIGNGRFSHWNAEGFIFSSTDNSNPRTTGRRYWVVLPKDRPHE